MPKALTLGDARADPTGATVAEGVPSWEAWDRFVAATRGGDIVQSSGWARAKRAIGFDICHVVCRRQGTLAGGALVVIKRLGPIKVGYIARGPLISPAGLADLDGILDEIEDAMRARGVHHVIIQPPEGDEAIASGLAARGYAPEAPAVAPTATLRIDLAGDLERIRRGMSAGKRRGLRRSERHGVEVRIGGPEDLELFQSLYQATARRQGFVPLSATYLRHHWQSLRATGSMQVFFAHHQDRELATLWLTAFGDQVTDRLSGWSGEARHLQLNVACCWAAIRWAKANGFRSYDLGGIDRPFAEAILAEEPLPPQFHRSPGAFKRELGADPVLLPEALQLTFNPVARVLVNAAQARFASHPQLAWLINRLRNG